jgi:hypothetical protein
MLIIDAFISVAEWMDQYTSLIRLKLEEVSEKRRTDGIMHSTLSNIITFVHHYPFPQNPFKHQ